jgi:hypothetical protein
MKSLVEVFWFFVIMLLCAICDGNNTIINLALVGTVVPFVIRLVLRAKVQEENYQKRDKIGEL